MQTGYFNAAWHDIKNSPGWFGKLLVLGLVSLIPVFGLIVVCGYLYGWARDLAWNVHAPLPTHVFGNEDGKLYSRGFFVLVISFVCSLIPLVVEFVGSLLTGRFFGLWYGWGHTGFASNPFGVVSGIVGLAFFVLCVAAYLFTAFFSWVGSMRMSIYGRLSAGFQFGKIWSMGRHDFNGIARVLGMAVLLFVGLTVIVTVLVLVVMLAGGIIGFFVTGGNMHSTSSHPGAVVAGMVFAIGGIAFLLALLAGFASMVLTVFSMMMVARALGYWTRQFNVPAWRGQDDPMPFELAGLGGGPGAPGAPGHEPFYQQPPR